MRTITEPFEDTTTIARNGDTLTIVTTVDLRTSPMACPIPVGLPYNTAATVAHLYR